MRNAVARFDDDFAAPSPERKRAPRKGGGKRGSGSRKKKGWRSHIPNVDMQKVARYGAIAMSVTVGVGIIVNALMLQKGRHPAPLFGQSIALGPSPVPAAAPAPVPVAPKPAPTRMAEAPAAPEPVPVAPHPVRAATDEDAIGRLLSGGGIAPDRPDPKTVAAAQKALASLGFGVKATGTYGPQTKKAIESYEKSRHLPVKGDLTPKLAKRLAAEASAKADN